MTQNIKGYVGIKLAVGDIVYNTDGYQTTPFPRIDLSTNRKSLSTIKRINDWLITNALGYAIFKNDDFNILQFNQMKKRLRNLSHSDKDYAEYYLYDT